MQDLDACAPKLASTSPRKSSRPHSGVGGPVAESEETDELMPLLMHPPPTSTVRLRTGRDGNTSATCGNRTRPAALEHIRIREPGLLIRRLWVRVPPPELQRRLRLVRGWGHDETRQVSERTAGLGSSDPVRAPSIRAVESAIRSASHTLASATHRYLPRLAIASPPRQCRGVRSPFVSGLPRATACFADGSLSRASSPNRPRHSSSTVFTPPRLPILPRPV